MHIFGKKKKEENSELLLVQVKEKGKYDFFAALAKALLLFLLVYGALGGFLSAFEIEYNKGFCMLVLFFLSLLLSATYETGKRVLTNILSMALFAVYLYVALSNYWAINSGYYYLMNAIFTKARDYLDISGGVEYSTVVQDEYSTVTMFVLFLGMVGVILLNIQMQNSCSLFKVLLLTFSPYVVPFYLDCMPSLIYMMALLAGYVTVAILQNGNVRQGFTKQMRHVLPLAIVAAVLIVRMAAFVIPEEIYENSVSESAVKTSSRDEMGKFAQYGMSALFQRGSGGAGMSGGTLSRSAAVMPNYETDLIVRYTPYSFESVYLKAFTGKDYTGERWTEAAEDGADDGRMERSVQSRKEAYEANAMVQGRGIMEVMYAGGDAKYEYRPYYTDYENVEIKGSGYRYTYYPAGGGYVLDETVDATYLSVPSSCIDAVKSVCTEEGFAGEPTQVAMQIMRFFDENYMYTLRPGFYYGDPDYISHFLLESKRGYCAHFASSATMLFRYMGIPARYVEGYAFSYASVVEDGLLVEGAEYKDYYDGYAPLGETALVELEIPDAYAHAWVEIYVEGAGWIVVDPTPASEEQETTSFWDAFMNMGQESEVPDLTESDFGTYLETALGGASYVILAAAAVTSMVLLISVTLRKRREKAMPGRERVCLEYTRLQQCLNHKDKMHKKLKTVAEQLACMRDLYGLEITEEQQQALYQAFFAPELYYDCDKLCKELVKMRRTLHRARRGR